MPPVPAHQFPHELDGHPLLAWMGEDWVDYVVLELWAELRRQVPGTEMLRIGCTGEPDLATRVTGSGAVSSVTLRIPLQMLLRDGAGEEHLVYGTGVFGGPDPRTVALEIASTPAERMIELLRRARRLVGDDEVGSEIDGYLARLYDEEPVRGVHGLFLPTGPLQELAESGGWGGEFLALADRADAITLVAEDGWMCRVCHADAGDITLSETGELRVISFAGELTRHLREVGPLWDAIAAGNAAAVYAVDPEFAPWWCPECGASYCGEHWAGGRCPQGHER